MGGQFAGQKLRIRTGDKNADVMCGPKGVDNQFKFRYILYFVNEQILFFSVFNSIFNVFIKGIRIAYFSEFIVFKIDINDMVIGDVSLLDFRNNLLHQGGFAAAADSSDYFYHF